MGTPSTEKLDEYAAPVAVEPIVGVDLAAGPDQTVAVAVIVDEETGQRSVTIVRISEGVPVPPKEDA